MQLISINFSASRRGQSGTSTGSQRTLGARWAFHIRETAVVKAMTPIARKFYSTSICL